MKPSKIKETLIDVVGITGLAVIAVSLIAGVILLVPFLVMAFWNDVVVALHGGTEITLWQSFLITLIFVVFMSVTNAIIQFFKR